MQSTGNCPCGDQSVYSDGCSVKSAVCFVDALTALGMTKLSLGMSVVRKVFYFSSTCFLPALFTAKDAFYAEPVADILAASVTSVVFFFVYRKYLKGSGRLGEIKL